MCPGFAVGAQAAAKFFGLVLVYIDFGIKP